MEKSIKNNLKLFKMKQKLILICIICLLISCNNSKNNQAFIADAISVNKYLKEEVDEKYLFIKSSKGTEFYDGIDSVYFNGNKIVESIENNTPDFDMIKRFYKESFCLDSIKRSKFDFNENDFDGENRMYYEINKIRILQSNYLSKILVFMLKTNFQTNGIGLKVDECSKSQMFVVGKTYELDMSVFYTSSFIKSAKVVIDNDTIKTDGSYFKYKYHCKKNGKQLIEPNIIIERWGKAETYKVPFEIGN